jgi:hypothetical protein
MFAVCRELGELQTGTAILMERLYHKNFMYAIERSSRAILPSGSIETNAPFQLRVRSKKQKISTLTD